MKKPRLSFTLLCFVLMVACRLAVAQTSDRDAAIDRLMIHELQSRYALAHDLTDPDKYAAVFTEDAVLTSGGKVLVTGRKALHDMTVNDRKRFNADAKEGERRFGVMRHVVTNSVVDLTGPTTATGLCYVMTIVNEEGVGPQILSIGRYEDEYRKVDGNWLIARRDNATDMGNQGLAKAIGLFGN